MMLIVTADENKELSLLNEAKMGNLKVVKENMSRTYDYWHLW
jgi:hypothetical protein